MKKIRIFDGHIDTLQKLFLAKGEQSFLVEGTLTHVDLMKAKQVGLVGSFCAIMVPPPEDSPERDPYYGLTITDTGYNVIPRSPIDCDYAIDFTNSVIGFIHNQVEQARGKIKIIKTFENLVTCINENVFSVILHLEGAAAIKKDLSNLEEYYKKGVCSIGLAWSRPNVFANGVPYKFPHSPDTGPGLTDAGVKLVKACNDLGIIIDLAHLNEKGFWDVANISNKPLVISHTGVHSLCPSTRNLTDNQIDAVGKSGGIIGILFDPINLQRNGTPNEKMSINRIITHIDYIVKKIGIDHVAFGSDFDGADLPNSLRDASFLPILIQKLENSGYTNEEVEKIAYKNWIRIIKETWKK